MVRVTREIIEKFKEARELIGVESRWTQHANARDDEGNPVSPLHKDATSFCLVGAIAKVCGVEKMTLYSECTEAKNTTEAVMRFGFHKYNDNHLHDDVLHHLDDIILDLQSQLWEQEANGTSEV